MAELTKIERRLTSFPTRKITVDEAIKSISKVVEDIAVAWDEVEDAQWQFNNLVKDSTYTLYDTERIERIAKWLHSATKRYYEKLNDLEVIKIACYESEIPKSAVEKYLKGVRA